MGLAKKFIWIFPWAVTEKPKWTLWPTQYICWSVAWLCPTLCNPMDYSMPGFPVLHCLLEFSHTWVHWVDDAIQSCHLLLPRSPPYPQSFPTSGSFPVNQFFTSGGHSTGDSSSTSVLPMNIQDWFPLGLTGLISLLSKELSRVFSSITVWKHQYVSTHSSLWSSSHIIHDYWKKHSFDYTGLCQKSDVSAF